MTSKKQAALGRTNIVGPVFVGTPRRGDPLPDEGQGQTWGTSARAAGALVAGPVRFAR